MTVEIFHPEAPGIFYFITCLLSCFNLCKIKALSTIAAIALLGKIKNIKCHVSKKRKRNMYNFASSSTIKSKHEYKILPRSKPKVLQRKSKTELSRYVLWNFAVTEIEKTICCRELHNLSALYLYIVSKHEIE